MSPSSPEIRIVLPVHRDAGALRHCLDALEGLWQTHEIQVVAVEAFPGEYAEVEGRASLLVLPEEKRGRARQMNAGAAVAGGDVLLFLHADTRLPTEARAALCAAWKQNWVGGAFERRFDSPSRFLRVTSALAGLRGRLWGLFLGDQAMFVRRDVFEALGGFPDIQPFEDLEFSLRLRAAGRTGVLRPAVHTSARRFAAEGPWRRTWKDVALTWDYLRKRARRRE